MTTQPADTDGAEVPDYLDLDSDNDGVSDLPAHTGLDRNGDGQVDDDTDTDRDGVPDLADPLPTAFGTNHDIDGDGVANAIDLDDDNDGVPDRAEAPGGDLSFDTDRDGRPDLIDLDSDNDGIADVVEADVGRSDADGDGKIDGYVDLDNDGLHDPVAGDFVPVDSDDDGQPDFRSLDSDGDRVFDLQEALLAFFDADRDGRVDSSADVDRDGWRDVVDTLVNGVSRNAGAGMLDTDRDGSLNFRDSDSDGDGTEDGAENADLNGDGIVDYLQPAQLPWKTATIGSLGPLTVWELALLLITAGTLWFVRGRNRHPS